MPRLMWAGQVVLGVALLAGGACSQQPQASSGSPTRSVGSVISPPPHDTVAPAPIDPGPDDRPTLARLEREARALAKRDGCSSLSACRTAPVGWRGCGGPRTYLVYCAATTDSVALFRKLAELADAERAYNAKAGMMSTCEFRMPPGIKLEGRSCRETSTGP
jgi:hypothetical protein